ncbi:M20 family metallopeptidase [Kiloniella laminariae]|uniref:M20 family metallopeptidase n=1 Tax=Kiloniella laminariae TaxID=454162 RepID=A0ABT4LES5_9PROT|nr:M20 aminoacylase family protein [Kiloniella laminariae]MCZ4279608.1 M20 family metallopeptidase [Kiloniella laminariae]
MPDLTNTPEQTSSLDQAMLAWRHDFHQHPELGFEESRTAGKVAQLLRDFGLEVHEGIGGTGVVGLLKRGSGKGAIGLRADMDALAITERNAFEHRSQNPGKMHACGHDGHTSMLLGAARDLAETGQFNGTVVFIFQPAEEHGRGALAMINDGLFERFPVDAIYALHNLPSLPTGHFSIKAGPVMACEDNFEIIIRGKGTHAALPHLGIDPILIGAEVVTALQSVISRTFNPTENGVLSVTDFATNGLRNVIPDQVTLRGDTRSFSPDVQDLIERTMQRIVAGICAAYGADHSFSYSREFVATINSPAEAEIALAVAQELVGTDKVIKNGKAIMASEDFGHMLQHKPGCYLLLGNGAEGPGAVGLHSPDYDFNDELLPVGAAFWSRLVARQLP